MSSFDFFNKFLLECSTESPEFLQIKNTELAEDFIHICNNLQGAAILGFYHNSEGPEGTLYKYNNNIVMNFSVRAFLPGLRCGETYVCSLKMFFEDVTLFTYAPSPVGESTEIALNKFIVKDNQCFFSCYSKIDDTKELKIICRNVFIKNFINSVYDEEKKEYEPLHTTKMSKEETIYSYIESGLTKSEMIEQLCVDYGISKKSALLIINKYLND